MKNSHLLLIIGLVFYSFSSYAQFDIQAGIFSNGTTIEIMAMPGSPIDNLVFSAVNFTIRWSNSYNVSLGELHSEFGISKNGAEDSYIYGSTDYKYQIFSGVPNQNVTWTTGSNILLMSIPVNQTGSGTGVFELAPSDFLPASGEWYIELGGINRTNSIFNPAAALDVPLPVEILKFNVQVVSNQVNINWQTQSEFENLGFEIERRIGSKSLVNINWKKIGFVSGSGTSTSTINYFFVDKNPADGSKFIYRLKQINNDGKFKYSSEVEVQIIPNKFELFQNYPNPFNPETSIKFSLPQSARVLLVVYNILGEKVCTLLDEEKNTGVYNIKFDAGRLASGIYTYRLTADNFVQTKRMSLIK